MGVRGVRSRGFLVGNGVWVFNEVFGGVVGGEVGVGFFR